MLDWLSVLLYCIVFWLTSLSTKLLLYKISTVSPICQSLNINYSFLSQKFHITLLFEGHSTFPDPLFNFFLEVIKSVPFSLCISLPERGDGCCFYPIWHGVPKSCSPKTEAPAWCFSTQRDCQVHTCVTFWQQFF